MQKIIKIIKNHSYEIIISIFNLFLIVLFFWKSNIIISSLFAISLPELWFIFGDKNCKNFIKMCQTGKKCSKCKESCEIKSNNSTKECKKLDIFARSLGFIERFYYFFILVFCKEQFFAILGAWITLKAAGNQYWKPDEDNNEINTHSKRARFILFLINNLISAGGVIIIFYISQRLLGCHEMCFWKCF